MLDGRRDARRPVRRTTYACAAVALLCAAPPAFAALPPADLHLQSSVERNADGQAVVTVEMATNADGREDRVTVRAHPGDVTCRRRNPLVLPTKSTIDLLFGVRLAPRLRWDSAVSFIAPDAAKLTVCGYIVNEAGSRLGLPYARRVQRLDVRLPRQNPAPPGHRLTCPTLPERGLVRLDARRLGKNVCRVARRVFEAYVADLRAPENPRDNWGLNWRAPGRKILRISAPRLRVSRLVVPRRAGALKCREAPVGTGALPPSTSSARSRPSASAGPDGPAGRKNLGQHVRVLGQVGARWTDSGSTTV